MRLRATAAAVGIGVCGLFPSTMHAAQSLFSGAVETASSRLTTNAAQTVFSIVVSLHNDPQGDGDPSVQKPGEQQTAYENIVGFFADGVCEESNGVHRLGTVRIFRKGEQSGRADVVWNATEHPRARISGFKTAGASITFGDVFPGGCGSGCDKDMLADAEGAGYTLAHEWGHYVYGVYDEYRGKDATAPRPSTPLSGDVPVTPSIMSSQWKAKGGKYEWLNHSTSNNYQAKTAQGRMYGKSAWEVLVQSTSNDPRSARATSAPARTQWTNLVGSEPTAADGWIKNELPAASLDCRRDLEIVWTDSLALQVIVDRSGSMAGSPLANALQAARTLVDVAVAGKTALGVVTFDNVVQQLVPVGALPAPDDGTKADIKSAISRITAGGTTAIFDAANVALSNLQNYIDAAGGRAAGVAFLLTDGMDNASRATEAQITAAYRAAGIPVVTFGYGDFAPTGVLRRLADATNGAFFSSPTTLAEVQAAFLAANGVLGVTTTVSSTSESAVPGSGTTLREFLIDPTISSFTVIASYAGVPAQLSLGLLDPGGTERSFACTAVGTSTNCTVVVDPAESGEWSIVASNGTVTAKAVEVDVVGVPKSGRTFDISAGSAAGPTVAYPAPFVITATPLRGLPMTGLRVEARLTDPLGAVRSVAMNDAGIDGDDLAGDGVYTALVEYARNGVHTVTVHADNRNLTGRFTDTGLQSESPTVGDVAPDPAPLPPVTDPFQRAAEFQVTVSGVRSDDHANSPSGTNVPATNVGVNGRIDVAGDIDVFRITGASVSEALIVRVARMAFGMNPALTLFGSTGHVLTSATLATGRTRNDYLAVRLTPDQFPIGPLYARVTDVDGKAKGTYEISAGPATVSDADPIPPDLKCYKAPGKNRPGETVLADRFESKATQVAKAAGVCTVVERDGVPRRGQSGYLTCFGIKDAKTKPKQSKFAKRTLVVTDAFGTHQLVVKKPRSLCVPTARATAPVGLESIKCYQASGDKVTAVTTLADEIESKRTAVLKPAALCNAVHAGGPRTAQWVCYAIKDIKTKPKQPKLEVLPVELAHQFGTESLEVRKAELLCVPTE